MPQRPTIQFDKEKLEKLKKDYRWATDNNVKTFKFDGHVLLVDYAKYMIEYLEPRV
jgi:hypothetical protein